ncbi:hypothetical protein GGTG_08673 [Gaeumannomyces tritici R3-111a-1]|uniref:Uncharacterized protein n=1 Tax=Gaeumannomyces tritici (strain R3-111a-1) TaxID=644352 RepID=J3P584_GAET3|nr:hypothetical protein GGTG_08673 [Gaeumannomyces tritici R3-111a-1]EJT74835.1 hypothetical protein GGTG_08673 [Gaeumannomyces tritici R3-111a-1]
MGGCPGCSSMSVEYLGSANEKRHKPPQRPGQVGLAQLGLRARHPKSSALPPDSAAAGLSSRPPSSCSCGKER